MGRDAPSILCVGAAACLDALEFRTQNQYSAASRRVGGGGTGTAGDGGGVRLVLVGDYRTIAFTVSVAYTPSVTPKGVTAPPTQGSLFSFPAGTASICTARAMAVRRARHASPLHSKSNCLPPLIRPPERVATFPQGKALPTFYFLGKQPMSRNRLTPSFSGTPCPAARR